MTGMTPRQRVLTALNHQEPDVVPLDVGGGTSTSISIEGYEALKRHLGVVGETRVLSKIFRVAQIDEPILQRLGTDFRPLRGKSPSRSQPQPDDPSLMIDTWGVTWHQAQHLDGCYYWELAKSPLAEAGIEDLERHSWPDPLDPGLTAGLEEEARALYEGTDYAIEASSGWYSLFELAVNLRGYEQLLSDLVLRPEFVHALVSQLLEINLRGTEHFLAAAGRYIHIYRMGDDLATQTGLLMSPRTYRSLFKPYYQRYIDFVKSHTDAKILYHSCGRVEGLLDDLIEIGVDAINPVQVSAMGDTAQLKQRFGSRVVFWGGVDTQRVMPYGTTTEVEAEVRRRIHDLAPGGGLVLAAVHSIQPDVPPENILALADAARRSGSYPVSV